MSEESWLPVVGYEGRYEVSDQGRVRSWVPYRGLELPRVRPTCIGDQGYPVVSLSLNGKQYVKKVHVLVAAAFLGSRPERLEVRHLNGIKTDCRVTNLAYGTRSENMLDRVRHGEHHLGSKTHCRAGHAFTSENTRYATRGNGSTFRICKSCERLRDAARRAARAVA